ncbi:unnamed protein product [Mytilus edulis]|uniref:Uncharacterized protein n=1 Tax=Mytilus edulis TaxID=6550 RepID=A0A8S3REK3_MYTED|nr:unnamed protein product [Mytilus edulis]
MKIVVVGSSHVRRLGTFIYNRPALHNFNLMNCEVKCLGIGGGKVSNSDHVQTILSFIEKNRPEHVIVHIGGNDLDILGASEDTTEELGLRLILLSQTLITRFEIKSVTICQLLPRESTRVIASNVYNDLVIKTNRFLKAQIKDQPHCRYWKITGNRFIRNATQRTKRSNRKRKSTQRLGEVIENLGSSDLGLGVSIDNSVPSSSNPNINSGQLSADNPPVQSNPIDPNTCNDDQILRILTVATPIITQTVVTILKSTGVIQGRDVNSPDPTLIPTHQGVNSVCPPRQDTTTCNTIEMTTPSQSHSTNIIDKQSSESSHPSCSNVTSRSGQQWFMPTEGSPSQQVVNHLLQGTPNTGTCSNELGGQGLSRPLALGVDPKLKADIWSNKYINLEDLLKSKSRVVKYVPVEKDDCLTFVKNSSSKAKIESMAQWHEAFRIYGAIYFEKYPTESPKLMKYAAIIANLAEKAGIEAAFFYDQAYRQWREVDPLHLPWDGVNGELFNEALAMGLIGKTNAMKQPFLTQSLTAPALKQKRFCYAFNNESGCTARICRYEHSCQNCGGDHSRRDCQQSKHENADFNSTNRRGP